MATQENMHLWVARRPKKGKQPQKECGIGFHGLILSPGGDIWPCHLAEQLNVRGLGNLNKQSFEELRRNLLRVRIWNKALLKQRESISCDCPHNEGCSKIWCPLFLESIGFKCRPEDIFLKSLNQSLSRYIRELDGKQKQRLYGRDESGIHCE